MSLSSDELSALEASLRNFIIKEKSNSSFDSNSSFKLMKYRGLSLSLDLKNLENPLFVVNIGALAASFSIRNGTRESGSLAGDEKIVYKWYMFGNIQQVFITKVGSTIKKKNK